MNQLWLLTSLAVVLALVATDSVADPNLNASAQTRVSQSTHTMHSVTRPLREVTLTSAAGTIASVFVEEGQRVRKGQRLLAFDQRMSEARVEMAKAEFQSSLSTVKVGVLESKLTTTRYQNLKEAYRQGAATEVEVTESHVRMQQARARYAAALDAVKQAEEQKHYAQVENQLRELVAPFDGIATRVFATPGQTPTTSQPLVQIVDIRRLRVDLYLPTERFDRQRKTYTLIAGSPVHRELTAKLVVMDRVIDPATQTIRCVLEFDNRTADLPAGFRVQLKPDPDDE